MTDVIKLDSPEALDSILEAAQTRPVLIFKHSLICPTSTAAYQRFKGFLAGRPADDETVYALVEIQRARDVSKAIAERVEVRHESPQAILLRDGKAAWDASHWAITEDSLADALNA